MKVLTSVFIGSILSVAAFPAFAAVTTTGVDMTAAGDWLAEVAAGTTNTVTVAQSGTGKIIKTGGGVLELTVDSTFTGGVELREGVVLVNPALPAGATSGTVISTALGNGDVTIVGQTAENTGICELHVFGVKTSSDKRSVSFANNITVTGNSTSERPALYLLGANIVFTGKITAAQDFYFFDDLPSTAAISSSVYNRYSKVTSATFGEIEAVGTIGHAGVCTFNYAGKVTTPRFDLSVPRPANRTVGTSSRINFHSQHVFKKCNAIGTFVNTIHPVSLSENNAFDGTFFDWVYTSDYKTSTAGCTFGKNKNQNVSAIRSSASIEVFGWQLKGGPAELTISGLAPEAGKSTRVITNHYARLDGNLSLTIDANSAFTQAFHGTAAKGLTNNMTGAICVKRGGMAVTGRATFAKAGMLAVEPEGSFICASTADFAALGSVTTLVVNGTLDLSESTLPPLPPTLTEIDFGAEGRLILGEGTALTVNMVKRNGMSVGRRMLTAANCPQLSGGTITAYGLGGDVTQAATWTGSGADEYLATPENWNSPNVNVTDGSLTATFASGGTRAVVAEDSALGEIIFDAPDGFTLARAEEENPPTLFLMHNIETTGKNAAYMIDVPLALPSPAYTITTKSGSRDHLTFQNAFAETRPPEGVLTLEGTNIWFAGTNTIAGGLSFKHNTVNVTGLLASPGHAYEGRPDDSAENILNYTLSNLSDVGLPSGLCLSNAVIEKAIKVNNKMGATAVYAFAGTTNEIKGFFRYTNSSWEKFRVPANAELTLSGGIETVHSFRLYDNGTLRIRNRPGSFLGSAGLNPSAGRVVLEVAGNTFGYICVGYDNSRTAKVETTVDYAITNGAIQVGGDGGHIAQATQLNSGTYTLDLHATTQRCECIGVMKKGILTGEYPAMLEVTKGRQPTGTYTNFGYSVVGEVTGGVGLNMCGAEDGVLLLTNRAFTSTGDLAVSSGTLQFARDASWLEGSKVSVSGTGTLKLENVNGTFNVAKAVLMVADEGKLDLAVGVKQAFHEGWLRTQDGTLSRIPAGTYSAAHPGVLTGHFADGSEGLIVIRRLGTSVHLR